MPQSLFLHARTRDTGRYRIAANESRHAVEVLHLPIEMGSHAEKVDGSGHTRR
jgi:hypothetical protein